VGLDGRQPAPRFGSDVLRFGSAVAFALLLNVAQVFIVPRRLSVEAYGEFRVFLLYIGYFGVFHLGLVDGAFLRWVGRPLPIIRSEWPNVVRWLLVMQLPALAGVAIAYAFASRGLPRVYAIALGLCAVVVNLAAFANFSLQASGDFRGAGRVVALPTAVFAVAVVVLPISSLEAILAAYIGAFAIGAAGGLARLSYVTREAQTDVGRTDALPAISFRSLIASGLPVLGTGMATGLSQFADRILVSLSVPVTTYALYGFASSSMAFSGAVSQTLSRVTLAHAARRVGEDRAAFFGWTYDVIAALAGVGLAAEPLFELVVTRVLPKYVAALPIVRALIPGALFWMCTSVVILGSLQTYGYVRRQFGVSLLGAALVATAATIALSAHAPLWAVAAAASGATVVTWMLGTVVLRRLVAEARRVNAQRFALIILAQYGALGIALAVSNGWLARTATYAAIAAIPTALAFRAARRGRGGERE
jgi:O-antigen/teichoic acid export membrane protein